MAKRNLAIFSIMIGDLPIYPYVKRNFQDYADKIGADFVAHTEIKHSKPYIEKYGPHYGIYGLERLEIAQLLDQYDAVLCLDSDIIIWPNARNIFEVLSDPKFIYAFNEARFQDRNTLVSQTQSILGRCENWPSQSGRYDYYNAGVILFHKGHQGFFEQWKPNEIEALISKVDMFEQSYFNWLFANHNFEVTELNYRFNRMELMGGHFRRLHSDFIHYAGSAFTGKHNKKMEIILDDFATFFPEYGQPQSKKHQLRRFLYAMYWPISIPSLNYF